MANEEATLGTKVKIANRLGWSWDQIRQFTEEQLNEVCREMRSPPEDGQRNEVRRE